MCLLAKLAYFLLCLQEKYFLVFSFCKMYQLVVLLFVTAWPQDQTSLDDTHVLMENSITEQMQWPDAFESKQKTELGCLWEYFIPNGPLFNLKRLPTSE